MKGFTYLIVNNLNKKWYYGVRYSIYGVDPKSMMATYFSSSIFLKEDMEKFGKEDFSCQIRRTFDDVESARKWEYTVLRRMKVTKREDCYNKHWMPGFPALRGDLNPSRRPEVRAKLSIIGKNRKPHSKEILDRSNITRIKHLIVSEFKAHRFSFANKRVKKYERYLRFLKENKPNYISMPKRFIEILRYDQDYREISKCFVRKNCNRTRHEGVGDLISAGLKGLKWYTNIPTQQLKKFREGEQPEGWVPGMKVEGVNRLKSLSSAGKRMSEGAKENMRIRAKGRRYYTSPDLTRYKVFKEGDIVPSGWVRGIKVKSRNDKITSYLKDVRYA